MIRSALRILIAVLCAAAALLIVLVLAGSDVDETAGKAIGTAVALSFFGLTGIAGVFLSERRVEWRVLGYATALVSALAFLWVVAAMWTEDIGWRGPLSSTILAVGMSQVSLLLGSARDDDSDSVRLIRIGTTCAVALLALMAFSETSSSDADVGAKPFAVVAILYVLGMILLPLMRRSSPPAPAAAAGGQGAAELLRRNHGHVLVEGPVRRDGVHGPGQSVSLREPDGTLIEVITYDG